MSNSPRGMRAAACRTILTISLAAMTVASGCGAPQPTLVPVTVKVAYPNKKPVAGARVMLQSLEGTVYRATVGQDGVGAVTDPNGAEGVLAGDYSVAIAEGRPLTDLDSPVQGPTVAGRFGSFETSGLTATVVAESPQHTFEFVVTPQ